MKKATARKNGAYGYKAMVIYPDGRQWTPVRKNFPDRESATAYAQKWIDANDNRPTGVRHAKVNLYANQVYPEGN